jgi:cytochrome c-type biogenesis protein CcmH/NrfG
MSAAVFWTIATVMVVLTTAAIFLPLVLLRRADESTTQRQRTVWVAAAGAVVLPIAALGVYSLIGSPYLVGSVPAAAATPMGDVHPGARPLQPGDEATDLGAAVERLEAKLARNPNDESGWRLLAQAYEFGGRAADAQLANERADRIARGESLGSSEVAMTARASAAVATNALEDLDALRKQVKDNPRDTNSMILLAETLRRKREFAESLAVFAKLAKTDAMNADLWADYADAHGARAGALDKQSAAYIAEALKLDSRHPKALWLLGSYQREMNDHRGALATWQRLASILVPESSDAKLIAANIAEARAALGEAGALPLQTVSAALSAPTKPVSSSAAADRKAVAVRGEVTLDPKWRDRVAPGSVLFVFAKPAGEAGPPLAVWRTTIGKWPIPFVLDDSSAMIPTRKLSDFRNVVVEARISRSGDAAAQPGDLQGHSAAHDPHAPGALRLVISKEIG